MCLELGRKIFQRKIPPAVAHCGVAVLKADQINRYHANQAVLAACEQNPNCFLERSFVGQPGEGRERLLLEGCDFLLVSDLVSDLLRLRCCRIFQLRPVSQVCAKRGKYITLVQKQCSAA